MYRGNPVSPAGAGTGTGTVRGSPEGRGAGAAGPAGPAPPAGEPPGQSRARRREWRGGEGMQRLPGAPARAHRRCSPGR